MISHMSVFIYTYPFTLKAFCENYIHSMHSCYIKTNAPRAKRRYKLQMIEIYIVVSIFMVIVVVINNFFCQTISDMN